MGSQDLQLNQSFATDVPEALLNTQKIILELSPLFTFNLQEQDSMEHFGCKYYTVTHTHTHTGLYLKGRIHTEESVLNTTTVFPLTPLLLQQRVQLDLWQVCQHVLGIQTSFHPPARHQWDMMTGSLSPEVNRNSSKQRKDTYAIPHTQVSYKQIQKLTVKRLKKMNENSQISPIVCLNTLQRMNTRLLLVFFQ